MNAAQCQACRHRQKRGGLIEAAQWQCTALEGEELAPALQAAVTGLLLLAAAAGQCPTAERWPAMPDAYLSADLPEA